ncbi:hypothetical protein ER308_17380 [Egibacter rhizosphaerae]|uniref:Uncharacterized protein n=1 Tax=Egibacter rhizosphaerae TaxID=1670831 RepID=A0A411YIS3_9ACTN|nr:hypothetical protein [Egibacter rhizosphaerae]QBI21168.1 hypothetical protein ER308_17380 [Egibacter rhizosphaerae]
MLSKLAGKVGFSGFETGSPAFDQRFRVHADDEAVVREVLHQEMIEFLLDEKLEGWDLVGGWLVATREGPWDSEELAPTADTVRRFMSLVPEHVWSARDSGASGDHGG